MKLTKLLENSINEKLDLVEDVNTDAVVANFVKKYISKNKQKLFNEFWNNIPSGRVLRPSFISLIETSTPGEKKRLGAAFKTVEQVDSLDNTPYTDFIKLWKIQGDGCGPGELYIMFRVNDARMQGPGESFDIESGGKKYEVKALDTGESGKAAMIRPGAEGKISRFPTLVKPLAEFFGLVSALKDPKIQTSILTLGDPNALQKILTIINDIKSNRPSKKLKDVRIVDTPGDIPISIMDSAYKGMLALKGKRIPKDITTSRIKVKSNTKDSSYWITPDDVDDITKSAGKDKEITIKVGNRITDENKEAAVLLVDLLNNRFVKNPDAFLQELSNAKNTFMMGGDKSGIIYFKQNKINVKESLKDFATIEFSGDALKFDLKTAKASYKDYPHVINQP